MPILKKIFSLNQADYNAIDPRFWPFIGKWMCYETYEGVLKRLPSDWDSSIFMFKYYEMTKEPGEPDYKADQSTNEKCLSLMIGWLGLDEEVYISLWINGKAVLDMTQKKVSAEIYKHSGAPQKLYFNNKMVTDFNQIVTLATQGGWFCPKFASARIEVNKAWVDDMNIFL